MGTLKFETLWAEESGRCEEAAVVESFSKIQ